MDNGWKRYAQNENAIRFPRAHFALVGEKCLVWQISWARTNHDTEWPEFQLYMSYTSEHLSHCIFKRHIRNGDAVRCPRDHFALVRNVHQRLADLLSEKWWPRTRQSSIMHVPYASEHLSSCTFARTASNTCLCERRKQNRSQFHLGHNHPPDPNPSPT